MSGRPLAFLTAGRAPSCWARDVARPVACLAALRRAGASAEAFAATRTRLRDEPLLGSCLASLVAETTRPIGAAPKVGRPAQPRSSRPASSPARAREFAREASWRGAGAPAEWPAAPLRTAHLVGEPGPHRAKPDLAVLPQQADGTLLRRLAGGPAPSPGAEPPHRGPDVSPGGGRRWRGAAEPQAQTQRDAPSFQPAGSGEPGSRPLNGARRLRGELPIRAREPAARHAWQGELARRVGHALRRAGPPRVAPAEPGEALLTRQWSAPIAGPTAPQALLIRLAGLSRQNGVAARSGGHDRRASRPAPGGRPREAFAAGNRAGARPNEATGSPLGEDGDHRAPDDVPTTSGQGERIAPPTLVSQLPPLIPPQVVGMPAPSVAAATARQGARAEATAAEEDLDTLAAKIKRILDEEARRHGIDV